MAAKPRRPTIELYCESDEQKQQINALAAARGLSTSKFLIGLAFANGRDVGARRRAEATLTNADLYQQLQQLNQTLHHCTSADPALLHQAIALLEDLGRELVLRRLEQQARQGLE